VADWETKRGWVGWAFAELEKAGYTVGSAYTAVKDKATARFLYRDRLWAGADLIGLGVASFGHLQGTHYQNQHDFEPYVQAVQSGRLPIYRAMTPTADERLIREFILQLKLGRTQCDYFQKKFGVDVRQRFAAPLQRLRDWGFGDVQDGTVRLTREGLLQVDRLLHEFFLPEHQNARYA
jgi:oxygen-independent coproporphyrinogen-3 oxidase